MYLSLKIELFKIKLIFRKEKLAQLGCTSAHPKQVPKPAQVKLVPETRYEPTQPPQIHIFIAGGQQSEVNPSPEPAPVHGLIKLHSNLSG